MDINLNSTKKILIERLSSLGDILLSTPLIRALKSINPALQIDFVLREEYEELLVNNPYITKMFKYTNHKFEKQIVFNSILDEQYDLAIDLQNNLRSKELSRVLQCPVIKFKKNNFKKFLLVRFKVNKLKNAPQMPVRYAREVNNISLDDSGLDFFTENEPNKSLLKGDNFIGLCPGAKHFTKQWLKENFIELGIKLESAGYKVVLFGGVEEVNTCNEIEIKLKNALNLCNTSLLQLGADMKMCNAIYTNDSGLMHLATAVKVPVISFFGSTVKEFGFFPYNAKSAVLEINELSCRPCTHIGRKSCPKEHFKCMKQITTDTAFQSLKQVVL
ncbi:MAG: glycosyltransferase family 9 protein [Ignavibacteria bacterium]|nr:glycosyltransferase family 9 protein [Ignavibacteria bacterium]MBT8383018.1 glycosyltransferase family 9 protein [Ignavibacteria bacterium]MBT8391879.1 glycosyltransferase family 9 protein [Ignavibacteria bacterium]NNJ52966.1 glycosyltransferase family 9 protein [Ignavibacteriaceae bacterium]NNL21441.1 glycosyltransferase family 9 protein [Ignavibacteriaceae bacterium]